MAHAITTTGTTTDPITTRHNSGESASTWVSQHSDAVASATPSGNKLTTTWTASSGDQKVETTRHNGESDLDFLNRHIQEYLVVMVESPPIP